MPMLHDATYRTEIQNRLHALCPEAQRRFGTMTVSQMLWHVNEAMEVALGKKAAPKQKRPLPAPIMKFLVLNVPWPKGAPTMPMLVAREEHDFEKERSRCLRLVDELAAKDLQSAWPDSPVFGGVCGRDVTRLHAKHLNHHLSQFGA